MPKFIMICGPQAVGKMTVGQELEKITELKLMHNHQTIDPLLTIFPIGSKERKKLTDEIRMLIFKEASNSNLQGIIFTTMFCFEDQEDWNISNKIKKMYGEENFYMIELETTLEERLKRNKTANRLACKPIKRDIEGSEKELLATLKKHRLNSFEGEIKEKNYLKIDNTNLAAEEVAKMIKEKFKL